MRTCDVLFNDDYKYSFDDAFSKFFKCIDENGVLCVHGFPNDTCDDDNYIICDMKYTDAQKDEEYNELKKLIDNIETLSKIADGDGNFKKCDIENASDELKQTYYTYIQSLNIGDKDYDKYDRIRVKMIHALPSDKFSKDEIDYMDRCNAFRNKDAKCRVGDNYLALNLIVFCQRVFRLLTLGAPKIIVDNDKNTLIKTYLIHKFATSYKEESK